LALRKRNLIGLVKLDNRSGLNRKYLNMMKLSLWRLIATFLLALLVTACGGGNGGSAAAPTDFKATPGNGQVTIAWTAQPGVEYWMMYAQTAMPIDIKNPPSNHVWATNITSPYVISGLTNGLTYSFAMNARTGGGKGGDQSASVSALPRYAGANWIPGTGLAASDWRGVAYGTSTADSLNYFMAVSYGGTVYKALDSVSLSLSGYGWTPVSAAPSLTYKAAINAFSKYIAVGAVGVSGKIVSSADFSSWTTASSPVLTTSLNALASNGTTLVAVGDSGTLIYTVDGSNWMPATISSGSTSLNLYGVAYSATMGWVAVGQSGALLTSSNGINWTVQTPMTLTVGAGLTGVAATYAGVFVAVGDTGQVMRSTDGVSWSATALGSSANLYAVSTDSVQFLAVGASGTVFTGSLDGSTWNQVTPTNAAGDLQAIVGSTSKYMVVGTLGSNISSVN
jgi:hypothetical protein